MRRICFLLVCLLLLQLPGRAAPETPRAALTFDDGPSGRFTRRLLEGLEQRETKATFFLCGYRIREDPELVRSIREGGHEIGSHGDSHKRMTDLSPAQLRQELETTNELLGETPRFLRPPEGRYNDAVCQAAREAGMGILTWSVDPRDWADHDVQRIVQEVLKNVRDGDVILMHDMSDSSVDAALQIVDSLKQQGFQLCTVSELASEVDPGEVYSRFPGEQETVIPSWCEAVWHSGRG